MMGIMAPLGDNQYVEVYCLKDFNITLNDENIFLKEGEMYYSFIGTEVSEMIDSKKHIMIRINQRIICFDKKNFGSLRELREKRLNDLGL